MTINNLSQELGITNKELISFLKENNFEAKSHLQAATDSMIACARDNFKNKPALKKEERIVKRQPKEKVETIPASSIKRFNPDDLIPCKSLVPWKVVLLSADRQLAYRWGGYGTTELVPYRDLQVWRSQPAIKEGLIMIEDPDLCYQWRNDLGGMYDKFLNVEYPEEFFDLDDAAFEKLLTEANDTLKEVLKYTAWDMIRNTNYPSVSKVAIMDKVLNTCIKDFL